MDGAVINEEIIINSLDVFEEDELKFSLSGETNLSNTQQTFLNINLQQFDSNDLSKLLKYTDQDDYAKYLDLYSFNNVEGNLIIDLATGNYVLENIEITQDENISTLSGNIFDEKFSGNLSLKNLDLENMEKFFLESSRLKGFLNLNLDVSQPIDLKNPKSNYNKTPGYTQVEIDGMSNYISAGYIDTFRHFYPEEVKYSWWSYRFNSRAKNVGWRLDYFLASQNGIEMVNDAFILNDVMGSDHCPVGIDLN